MSEKLHTRVAVLYQAIDPPIINSVRKLKKPGGYQDSGADIAFALQSQPGIDILTPCDSPDPADHTQWCFPDTEDDIPMALAKGATHLWANTNVFASHPLQSSWRIGEYQDEVRAVGQPPALVEQYDDKGACTVHDSEDLESKISALELPYPVVGKPVRGRGSFGVKVCNSADELFEHVRPLSDDSPIVIVEKYLAGEEATITVMPPSKENPNNWAMPIVTRFNHENDIAPDNGIVAVTANSRVVKQDEYDRDPNYAAAARNCESAANLLRVTAPIRVDIRRFSNDSTSKFALFDVNMKPVNFNISGVCSNS